MMSPAVVIIDARSNAVFKRVEASYDDLPQVEASLRGTLPDTSRWLLDIEE